MLTQCLKSPEEKKKTKYQFPQINGRIPEKCRRVTVKQTHINQILHHRPFILKDGDFKMGF